MKILIPTVDYPPIEGGISTVTVQLARELSAMGHEVTVVAPWFEGMAEFDSAEPVTVIRFSGYSLGRLRLLPFLFAAGRHVREADLVLGVNIGYGGVLGYMGLRGFGKPYVTFGYAYEFLRYSDSSLIAAMMRGIYQHSRAVVAISRFTRDSLVARGLDAEQIRLVLPGATVAVSVTPEVMAGVRYKYVLDDAPVILAVGRFIPRKNHVVLVRALPKILASVPNAMLLLVGQGPTIPDVLREAQMLGVRDRVVVPGYVPETDLAALYDTCDVFALPAGEDENGQVEGFGLVFAEANAHGKPVVAGRSGGVEDAVVDGETGLLVNSGDVDEVADAIIRLLTDPVLAMRLGENGRRRVEKELNWRRFAEGVLATAEVGVS